MCLGNISKDWSVDNMKKTGLKGYAYNYNVDYNAIAVAYILDIHMYLMKKNGIVWNVHICKKSICFSSEALRL